MEMEMWALALFGWVCVWVRSGIGSLAYSWYLLYYAFGRVFMFMFTEKKKLMLELTSAKLTLTQHTTH